MIDTFDNLQTALKNGSANESFGDSVRLGQPYVNWYYHNFFDYRNLISGLGIEKIGGLQNMVNCPYPVNYYNRLFQYDVTLSNYLVNVHNLVFTIRGVLEPDQPDPTDPVIGIGYPFIRDPVIHSSRIHQLVGLILKVLSSQRTWLMGLFGPMSLLTMPLWASIMMTL